jgi:hypothetical protein
MTPRSEVAHRKDVDERVKGQKKTQPAKLPTYSQSTAPTLLPTTTFQPER